jgi:hypothetical protein
MYIYTYIHLYTYLYIGDCFGDVALIDISGKRTANVIYIYTYINIYTYTYI